MGTALGAVGFAVASLVYGLDIGTVIGLTIVSVCTMAATVGGMMPLLAKTIRVDPAVFSAVHLDVLRRDRAHHLFHDRQDRAGHLVRPPNAGITPCAGA